MRQLHVLCNKYLSTLFWYHGLTGWWWYCLSPIKAIAWVFQLCTGHWQQLSQRGVNCREHSCEYGQLQATRQNKELNFNDAQLLDSHQNLALTLKGGPWQSHRDKRLWNHMSSLYVILLYNVFVTIWCKDNKQIFDSNSLKGGLVRWSNYSTCYAFVDGFCVC